MEKTGITLGGTPAATSPGGKPGDGAGAILSRRPDRLNAAPVLRRLKTAVQRRLPLWLGRRPFAIPSGRAVVSFTFDDFPRSALFAGGRLLRQVGASATYYASLGLMGRSAPTGEIFLPEDIETLQREGHEIGCHTFDHCHAWDTLPREFERSLLRNATALNRLHPSLVLQTHSYPISYPRPSTKLRVARYFSCSRGGGQTFNSGVADLNYLSAFFLEQCAENIDAIHTLMRQNASAGGWLILATHDVSDRPTRFGCSLGFFEAVVDAAITSGAKILPVHEALQELRRRKPE